MQNTTISESVLGILKEFLITKDEEKAIEAIQTVYSNAKQYSPARFSPIEVVH